MTHKIEKIGKNNYENDLQYYKDLLKKMEIMELDAETTYN